MVSGLGQHPPGTAERFKYSRRIGTLMDDRGQSVLLGAVLLFGILIIAFAGYQAYQIPDQNAQTEFRHFEAVKDDMVDLRAAVLDAAEETVTLANGQTARDHFATITLGTQYRERIFGINPPPATGQLNASPPYTIGLLDANGGDVVSPLSTRFVTYRPTYNQLPSDTIRLEHSLLYLEPGDNGDRPVFLTERPGAYLVDDGTFRVVQLRADPDFTVRGTQRATIQVRAASQVTEQDLGGVETVVLPTNLGCDGWGTVAETYQAAVSCEGSGNTAFVHRNENLQANPGDDATINEVAIDLDALAVDDVRVSSVGLGRNGGQSQVSTVTDGESNGDGDGIRLRVDDLTDLRSNNPRLYVSYDLPSIAYDTVELQAESTTGSASDSTTTTADRGGALLAPGFGAGESFTVTVTARSGGSVVAQERLSVTADATNPGGNDDLGTGQSATLDSLQVADRTNTQQNDPRFDLTYQVSGSGSFSTVRLFALNVNGNGASATLQRAARQGNNIRLDPTDGANTDYRVGVLVLDDTGAVVDERSSIRRADGT